MQRWGITIPLRGRPLADQAAWMGRLLGYGYTDLWTQETDSYDAFTPLGLAAAWAPDARLGTAIASVFTRGPAVLAMQASALAEAAPGRFVLGIGSSSAALVSGWNGRPFERPYARVRDTLAFLRTALAGERVDGPFETLDVRGFRLERPPAVPPPIFLAALGPRMLKLAQQAADGALLSMVSPEDVERIRLFWEQEGGSPGPAEIGLRIGVVVDTDRERARARCRRLIAGYLTVDRYAALHRWLGRETELEPLWQAWRAGDRNRAVAAVPDALVDSLFVHGDLAACREGLARFVAAGVSLPIISLMAWTGDLEDVLSGLAPVPPPLRASSSG
ncbi:MAG: LLM class F420-dependent oxidoreductase [Myxococcota bacterium]